MNICNLKLSYAHRYGSGETIRNLVQDYRAVKQNHQHPFLCKSRSFFFCCIYYHVSMLLHDTNKQDVRNRTGEGTKCLSQKYLCGMLKTSKKGWGGVVQSTYIFSHFHILFLQSYSSLKWSGYVDSQNQL